MFALSHNLILPPTSGIPGVPAVPSGEERDRVPRPRLLIPELLQRHPTAPPLHLHRRVGVRLPHLRV